MTKAVERKPARYRDQVVEVLQEFFRCAECEEELVTPEQMANYARAVKNEVRKKHGLLSPERITDIRKGLNMTQQELEELLGTGPKVVVRWESGKVIQSSGQDNILRLLERDPEIVGRLRQIQKSRARAQREYRPAGGSGAPSGEPVKTRR
jgi:putative zinc finger/helix-turn-helix YgiT family protein